MVWVVVFEGEVEEGGYWVEGDVVFFLGQVQVEYFVIFLFVFVDDVDVGYVVGIGVCVGVGEGEVGDVVVFGQVWQVVLVLFVGVVVEQQFGWVEGVWYYYC